MKTEDDDETEDEEDDDDDEDEDDADDDDFLVVLFSFLLEFDCFSRRFGRWTITGSGNSCCWARNRENRERISDIGAGAVVVVLVLPLVAPLEIDEYVVVDPDPPQNLPASASVDKSEGEKTSEKTSKELQHMLSQLEYSSFSAFLGKASHSLHIEAKRIRSRSFSL